LAAYLVSSALLMSVMISVRGCAGTARRARIRDGLLILGADHDAVGTHEVFDRGTFLQELGLETTL
jgi:hypothetical protein